MRRRELRLRNPLQAAAGLRLVVEVLQVAALLLVTGARPRGGPEQGPMPCTNNTIIRRRTRFKPRPRCFLRAQRLRCERKRISIREKRWKARRLQLRSPTMSWTQTATWWFPAERTRRL